MARLHVKITEYVRDDDPVIAAAAARAAYDASLHLWRLVEDRREQTITDLGLDDDYAVLNDHPAIDVPVTPIKPVQKRIPYSLVRAWAIDNGCDYGHNSRPPKAVQDAYIAATGGTQ